MQGNSRNEAEARGIAARARDLAAKVEQLKLEIGVECDELRVRSLRLATKQAELDRVSREIIQVAKDAQRQGGW